MIKEIAIQISVKHVFLEKEKQTMQRFTILGSKRNWRYLLDPRFYSKKIFDEEIKKRSLSTMFNSDAIFIKKVEEENIIDMFYETQGLLETDYYFTIHDFIPTSFGCEYCFYNKENIDNEFVECDFFRKKTKRRKSSCKYFNQRRLFKT